MLRTQYFDRNLHDLGEFSWIAEHPECSWLVRCKAARNEVVRALKAGIWFLPLLYRQHLFVKTLVMHAPVPVPRSVRVPLLPVSLVLSASRHHIVDISARRSPQADPKK